MTRKEIVFNVVYKVAVVSCGVLLGYLLAVFG